MLSDITGLCTLTTQSHGHVTLARDNTSRKPCYIHLLYVNRAFEWVQIRHLFLDCLRVLGLVLDLDEYLPLLDDVVFGWTYLSSIATILYKPRRIFCDFDTESLKHNTEPCICLSNRFRKFLDPLTIAERHFLAPQSHVRTTDLTLIHAPSLRHNIQKGLNHIPL